MRRALVAAVALVLLAACSDTPDDDAGQPIAIRATAEQWRVHEVNRQLAIALHNDGDTPVRVSRVEPVLPSFDGETPADTDAVLPVGGLRVDVPVLFGTGGCTPTRAAPSQVIVTARPEGAADWQRVALDLPHPAPLLDKLLALDCATERIEQSVTLSFGPWQDLGAGGVRGSLVVERTAAATGPVTVTELDGNVLYRLAFPDGIRREVTAANPRAQAPLVVTPLRCDAHAFAEVKKPFEFPVHVALGDGEALATPLPVDEDDRAALDTMLRRICEIPGPGESKAGS